jgi:uncharacterized protein YceH (UPF0502 family)
VNLDDRIALILGRASMNAIAQEARAQTAEARVAELESRVAELEATSAPSMSDRSDG